MIFRIPSGKHRARPTAFRIWWGKNVWKWRCSFGDSARYTPDPEHDTNKLVGVGFLPWHHKYSVRVGWRYMATGKIELSMYAYQEGVRMIKPICQVAINQVFYVSIGQTATERLVIVYQNNEVLGKAGIQAKRRRISYRLGLYFGGQNPAPHAINVLIEAI